MTTTNPPPASPRSGRAASPQGKGVSPRSEPQASEGGPPQGRRAKKENWTILDLLRWTTQHFQERGIETARLDAECLLAFALGVERMRLYLDFDKPVTQDERAVFRELVGRRGRERVPVAQLVGRKEFWSLSLRVAPGVLAPRPETETLVAAALELLPDCEAEARVLDVGTGSGAVALAIAGERPRALLTPTAISPVALEVARENAEELGLAQRIRLLPGSLFEPVQGERFDLVVSNPPYVAESLRASLPPELDHEPPRALFAGPDGLGVLLPLLRGVGSVLAAGGRLALEFSPEQAPRVVGWCRGAGLLDVTVRRDLAGRPRVVMAKGGD
jgi:release factor glutamine methyltransferase